MNEWIKYESSRSEVTNLVRHTRPAVMVRMELVWVEREGFLQLNTFWYLKHDLQEEWESTGRLDSEKDSIF